MVIKITAGAVPSLLWQVRELKLDFASQGDCAMIDDKIDVSLYLFDSDWRLVQVTAFVVPIESVLMTDYFGLWVA